MATDKSLFYYGPIYHKILNPTLAEARQVATNFIPEKSSVLDIACGTSVLPLEQKRCRVVGLDLSLRMLEFAQRSNPMGIYHLSMKMLLT